MELKRNSIESYAIILDDGSEISLKKPNFDKKTNKYWCALPESVMEILGRKTIVVQSDDVNLEVGESKDVNEFFGRKSTSGEKVQRSADPTKLPKVSNNFSHTIELLMEEFDNEEESREFYRLYLIAKKKMDTKALRKQIEELQKKLDEMMK